MSGLHIDHIVPESLADDPAEFDRVKATFQLGDDFDLCGFGNLLLAKQGPIFRRAPSLEPSRIHYFLGIAASKKPEVEKHLQRFEKRQSGGRALVLLQQCLERGELSPHEVAGILEEHGEHPQEIFGLVEGMKFSDSTEVNAVAKADIENLRHRPLKLGQNDHIDGVTLTHPSGEKVFVKTCKDYDDARRAGYYAFTNFNIKCRFSSNISAAS